MLKAKLYKHIKTNTMTSRSSPLSTKIGLANLGNTCFLNVVLQALRISPPVGSIFLSSPSTSVIRRHDSKKKEMATAFQTLIRDFWGTEIPVTSAPTLIARGFMHSMITVLRETGDDWYHHGQQADAAEALQYIMDSLHDAMYRSVKMDVAGVSHNDEEASQVKAIESWAKFFSKEYSPIVQQFNGQTQICIKCETCGAKSERYEPWLMVKAPIPGADKPGSEVPTMIKCLDSAFEPETLDDYNCDECKTKGKATIQSKISRLPPVTIVSLKRFTNRGHKVCGKVEWDLDELDFRPWMAFRRDPFTNSTEAPVYTTFAVIEHLGSTMGGHYRMFSRQDDTWLEYDDSSVRIVDPDHVVTSNSYIAFMMPKTAMESMNAAFAKQIQQFRTYKESLKAKEA